VGKDGLGSRRAAGGRLSVMRRPAWGQACASAPAAARTGHLMVSLRLRRVRRGIHKNARGRLGKAKPALAQSLILLCGLVSDLPSAQPPPSDAILPMSLAGWESAAGAGLQGDPQKCQGTARKSKAGPGTIVDSPARPCQQPPQRAASPVRRLATHVAYRVCAGVRAVQGYACFWPAGISVCCSC
jgi:hypothetical protein